MRLFLPILVVLAQTGGWTASPSAVAVGDTVRIARRTPAVPDVTVRLEPLAASEILQPLAPPRWSYAEGIVDVTYTLAMFQPGLHEVAMPAIDLVYPNGRIETLPGGTAMIEVVSVLPAEEADAEPKPSLAPIPRVRRSLVPPILLPLAAVGLTAIVLVHRRRRRPRPTPPASLGENVHPPIESWIAAGESRAVATIVALDLRHSTAEAVPEAGEHLGSAERYEAILEGTGEASARDLVAVLRSLERARFSPAAPADIHEVVDEAGRAMRAFRASRERAD
jgi:hypothetical protein